MTTSASPMRAATLVAPGRFLLQERAAPVPAPGEVLIRVRGCGVCASNLGPWAGIAGIEYPLRPGAPGHEVFGVVEAVGVAAAAGPLAPGDVVTALSYHAFADFDVADAAAVVRLPPALAHRPVLGEPLACAVNVARRAGVREGDTVVVLGIGFLGAVLVRLLRDAGAARILAVSRRPDSLDFGRLMGADEALAYDDDVAGRVAALTGGRMADVVVECTGHQAPLDLAGELTRVRGRVVIAGYHQDGPRRVDLRLWNWRGLDVINAHEREPAAYAAGMAEAVRRIASGTLDVDPLLTHVYPLADIGRAFADAAARPPGFCKAVVVPDGDA
jgi:threonine dehydrogenase-like Zn-dependent dehydrogenase